MDGVKVEKWRMYNQIFQLKELGFSKSKIAKKLGIARGTVISYLEKDPEEMSLWLSSTKKRTQKLDKYKTKILKWLRDHPDLSASQISDWLDERYPDFIVAESTVRRYVRELRKEYNIPKTTRKRVYEAVPDLPMGFQAQVDFGQCWQLNQDGQSVKLYVVAFVLSHSRFKYMEWLDRPFTTKDLIEAHRNAFHAFGGKPKEIVYDQDNIIVVSENSGDIIYTKLFESYRREESFQVYACRGHDPESKGKIENVIGFIKKNFAKHRVYTTLDEWNEQGRLWLERRGNGKIHNTTKKRPVDVFQEEKHYLRPVKQLISVPANDKQTYLTSDTSITRVVRKDNTILYKANRYSLPLGTYSEFSKVVRLVIYEGTLSIIEPETGEVIGVHEISTQKGVLIQDRTHMRDRSKGILAFKKSTAAKFDNRSLALAYLNEINGRYPRYIRDQLQVINKTCEDFPKQHINQALVMCIKLKLYSAAEFHDMVKHLMVQRPIESVKVEKNIQPLHEESSYLLEIKPTVRDISPYIMIMKGGDPS